VTLNGKAGGLKDRGELFAQIPIGEKDKAQAARSYRMARRMSSTLRS
jgi:hypothetical protein